ncbi:unnamed protein product [Fraxinus pennsylvanica]|uniref:non-specific serine/threonine protein kinase n=1 Tax=Fraxinus pennsylvanica TaxID=56036 RepID=A0AAD1ZAS5_9LAMI|nr:unnamed protein product [Fraxinus pennsylvanica]
MSDSKPAFLSDELSKRTSIFGLRLWVIVGICVGAAIVIFLFLISLWITSRRNSNKKTLLLTHKNSNIPKVSREIQEIRVDPSRNPETNPKLLLPAPGPKLQLPEPGPVEDQKIHVEIGKGHRIACPEKVGQGSGSGHGSGEARPLAESGAGMAVPEVSHLGWGHWYTLRELEEATDGFANDNVIGEGGYGIVYHGLMEDKTRVAVKNLLNNRGQAEREFKDRRAGREHGRSHRDSLKERVIEKHIMEPGDSSGYESSIQTDRSLLRKPETDEEK